MGKHAGLAHAHDLGQRAYAQAFQPDLRGQAQGRIDNGRFGLLAFLLALGHGAAHGGSAGGFGGEFCDGHGGYKIKRTVVLFCNTLMTMGKPGLLAPCL